MYTKQWLPLHTKIGNAVKGMHMTASAQNLTSTEMEEQNITTNAAGEF